MKNWPQTVAELTSQLRNLRGGAPEVMKAFGNIAQAALAPKALDGKTRSSSRSAFRLRLDATIALPFMSRQLFSKALVARK